jgi:hypothetical protein
VRAPLARRLAAPITPGALRSVVALFILMLALSAANLLFTVHYVSAANHKFCQVVTGVTAVPVPRPPDPKANPSREKQFELYEQFVALGRSLGC